MSDLDSGTYRLVIRLEQLAECRTQEHVEWFIRQRLRELSERSGAVHVSSSRIIAVEIFRRTVEYQVVFDSRAWTG